MDKHGNFINFYVNDFGAHIYVCIVMRFYDPFNNVSKNLRSFKNLAASSKEFMKKNKKKILICNLQENFFEHRLRVQQYFMSGWLCFER